MNPNGPDAAELAVLAAYAPHLAQAFASLACDIALVLDGQGRITAVAHNEARSLAGASAGWLGQSLADTVTLETRFKIEALLEEVARDGLARRREVNLPQDGGEEPVAVAYTALRLGPTGPVLAVGQDLRAVSRMQQRFLRVQRELERGYIAALAASRAGEGGAALPGLDDRPLDEASRAAFAAWLHAERLASEPPPEDDPGATH
jgi:nitrogen-specific signal transduction histidine kinase